MRRRLVLVMLASLLLAPVTATADDVPVIYTVEQKPLKAAVAGVPLAFSLFSDASCSELVSSTLVSAEDVDRIVRLKLHQVKGGAKQPKIGEIRHTLTGVAATEGLYLTVVGTGITPVGSACQAQASSGPTEWHWINIDANASVNATSPSMAGTGVARPAGSPTGVYCLTLPSSDADLTGAVASLEKNQAGLPDRTIMVTNGIGHACNDVSGWDLAVDVYDVSLGDYIDNDFIVMIPGSN